MAVDYTIQFPCKVRSAVSDEYLLRKRSRSYSSRPLRLKAWDADNNIFEDGIRL